jgi:hypothetical protein
MAHDAAGRIEHHYEIELCPTSLRFQLKYYQEISNEVQPWGRQSGRTSALIIPHLCGAKDTVHQKRTAWEAEQRVTA